LRLGSIGAQLGESINEFSSDVTLGGNSNIAVPTEAAVKRYVDSYTVPTDFDSSTDVTEDVDGYIDNASIGGIGTTYSNIVYETVGDPLVASYKRITSYDQTIRGVTHSITLTYNANGSVNTVTAVLS